MSSFQQLLSALTALVMTLSAQVGNFTNAVPPSNQLAQVFSPGVQFSVNQYGLQTLTYTGYGAVGPVTRAKINAILGN